MGYFSYEFVSRCSLAITSSPTPLSHFQSSSSCVFQDAVDFRKHSLKIIDQLQNGTYVARQNNLPVTPSGSIATTILPIPWHSTPVLYQVVSREQKVLLSTCTYRTSSEHEEFVFVTPPTAPHRVFGLVLEGEDTSFRPCKVAFESVPDAVTVSPRVLRSLSRTMKKDDIVLADTRVNVSTAIRFSESPASVEDQLALCKLVRPIIPSHPQEGLLPLKIFDIPRDERDWIDDRIGRFTNYFKNPREAHHKMTQLFNVGCSALLAIEVHKETDSYSTQPHCFSDSVPLHFAPGVRSRLDSESLCVLWIVGAASVVRVSILRTKFDPQRRTLDIQLVSSARLHRSLMQSVNEFSWKEKGTKLARQCVNRTVPVYPMLTKHKLFENITRNSECRGAQVLDAVYNNLSSYKIAGSDYLYADRTAKRISLDGKSLELGSDQVAAIRLGCDDRRPIVAIRGPFGSGKTLVAALIAARVVRKQKGFSIITATTNGAVAQITDTVLKLDEYRDLSRAALRVRHFAYRSILKRLPDDYFEQLSREDLRTCQSFKKGRELLEKYLFTPENGLHLTASEQKEYRLAEQEVSAITSKAIFALRNSILWETMESEEGSRKVMSMPEKTLDK
ncbi:hypothetical protein OSTOST_06098, partial [Ostertagia ostertagi]